MTAFTTPSTVTCLDGETRKDYDLSRVYSPSVPETVNNISI